MKGILPDDGRHDKTKPREFEQTSEWCEGCQTEFELNETTFIEDISKWLCQKCINERKK
jgi:hypothetical protein